VNEQSDLNVQLVGQRLLQLRELRGLSLSAVAAKAELAKSYLAKLERGEVPNPGVATLYRIASVLGASLADLFAPATGSHRRARWSALVDPLEIERIRESMAPSLTQLLTDLEKEEGHVPADVVRSLALIQFRGKRPEQLDDWRFVYEAIKRSIR